MGARVLESPFPLENIAKAMSRKGSPPLYG